MTVCACGSRTSYNCYFNTSQDDWTSLLLDGSVMNPLILFCSSPNHKLSHNYNNNNNKKQSVNFQRPPGTYSGTENNKPELLFFKAGVTVTKSIVYHCFFFLFFFALWHNLTHTPPSDLCCLKITIVPQIFPLIYKKKLSRFWKQKTTIFWGNVFIFLLFHQNNNSQLPTKGSSTLYFLF